MRLLEQPILEAQLKDVHRHLRRVPQGLGLEARVLDQLKSSSDNAPTSATDVKEFTDLGIYLNKNTSIHAMHAPATVANQGLRRISRP